MANYGFKVSKPGYTVTSATDSQLIFTSKYYPLKIIQVFENSYTFTTAYTWLEIQHSITQAIHAGVIGFARLEATNNPNVSPPLGWEVLPTNVTYGQIACYYKYDGGPKACFLYNKPGSTASWYTYRYKLLVLGETCIT